MQNTGQWAHGFSLPPPLSHNECRLQRLPCPSCAAASLHVQSEPAALPAAHAVEYSPFYGIEKGAVLQEARVFNDSHVDPRRCQQVRRVQCQQAAPAGAHASRAEPAPAAGCRVFLGACLQVQLCSGFTFCPAAAAPPQVITKLLYLLTQGESFTKVGGGQALGSLPCCSSAAAALPSLLLLLSLPPCLPHVHACATLSSLAACRPLPAPASPRPATSSSR